MPENTTPETQHTSAGPAIGIAIIVALLALGGYYFYSTEMQKAPAPLPYIPEEPAPVALTTQTAPSSDAPADIAAEIDTADIAAFEAQMNADLKAPDTELR